MTRKVKELILLTALYIVNTVVGEFARKLLLFNSTISQRITDVVKDKEIDFRLQIDEDTNNSKDTYLIYYV